MDKTAILDKIFTKKNKDYTYIILFFLIFSFFVFCANSFSRRVISSLIFESSCLLFSISFDCENDRSMNRIKKIKKDFKRNFTIL